MSDTRELLERALAQQVITPEQHEQLIQMSAPEVAIPSPDERFRILNGFNEFFISIGLIILMTALRGIVQMATNDQPVALIICAGFAWMGAMYFVDRKKVLLPSIVCCLYAANYFGTAFFYLWLGGMPQDQAWNALWDGKLPLWNMISGMVGSLAIYIAAVWRFRIPFLMLPIAILFTIIMTIAAQQSGYGVPLKITLILCGLATIGLGVYFDFKDPKRVKRYSDFAFWCYVVGSPVTVHSFFISVLFNKDWGFNAALAPALFIILFAGLITFGALLLNRRAFILSTLIYVTFSVNYLFMKVIPGEKQFMMLLTAFLIGCYVVCLGTVWRKLRHWLMSHLTPRSWFAKLPAY